MAELTTFDYLLNRMEFAATSENPARAGYAAARRDVLEYVAALVKLSGAQDRIIVAYRTSRRSPEIAIDHAREADEALERFNASVRPESAGGQKP
jgi:hypothetical protein